MAPNAGDRGENDVIRLSVAVTSVCISGDMQGRDMQGTFFVPGTEGLRQG
ncbi:hypothetical protein ACI3KT_16195 [Microbacterium sp. ZW T6_19]